MHEFFVNAGYVVVGAIVGGGLVYGFRGWIQRTKNKLAGPYEKLEGIFRADVQTVHSMLSGSVIKAEADAKADVHKALAALSKWLPILK